MAWRIITIGASGDEVASAPLSKAEAIAQARELLDQAVSVVRIAGPLRKRIPVEALKSGRYRGEFAEEPSEQ